LPPGLTFATNQSNSSTAAVSGMPTALGTYSFTVQAVDSSLPQTATANFTIVVDSHVVITKSQLKTGGQNQAFSDSFTAIDGTPPYSWTLTGSLPGLTFDSATGTVSGTPTQGGGIAYTIKVTDSSTPAQTDTAQGLLNLEFQVALFTNLAPAYISVPYNSSFFANGGSTPHTFRITSGSLPPGLALNSFGYVIGTPTQLGSFPFVVQVTDSSTPPYVVSSPVTMNVTPTPLSLFANPVTTAPLNVPFHTQIPLS